MTTPNKSYTFRVTGVTESGPGRITVNFTEQQPTDQPGVLTPFANNFTLNLSAEDAAGYFPGQSYTVAVAPAPAKA